MIPVTGKDVMPEKVVKDKVLCYVVRDGRLLVFRHTDYSYEEVGIQVPAGSVRPGETPEDAALREAREETVLTEFTIVQKLGETEYDISPYRFEIQRRHVFRLVNARFRHLTETPDGQQRRDRTAVPELGRHRPGHCARSPVSAPEIRRGLT